MKRLKPALLAVCLSCGLAASAFAADAVKTRPFNAMPADFIKGADISTLLEAEQHGAKFYNQNGQQQDAIAILKANGVKRVACGRRRVSAISAPISKATARSDEPP